MLEFTVDGRLVSVASAFAGASLLEVLRDQLGVRTPKDGCSPQGQCGCCTVLVDGQPRVACVTPARRVEGRTVTTLEGFDPAVRDDWAARFSACGASQCGFCTPGIITRLATLPVLDRESVEGALLAHLCRCTGWQTIVEAALTSPSSGPRASQRATLEGGAPQAVGPEVALGRGGFADDTAPLDALVAVPSLSGWVVGETLTEARNLAGKVQGRRSTVPLRWPLEVPPGDWDITLRTTWVEPAYLEPDAAWCAPGGEPVGPLANGGAFGGKVDSPVAAVAARLAEEHGRPVRVVMAREDVVRLGPKRPPIAAGVRSDGTGVVRMVRTRGVAAWFTALGFEVEEVDVPGPPTSAAIRGAGWVEAAVLRAVALDDPRVVAPSGGWATASVSPDGIEVVVSAGPPLDETVLRSYCIGAAHQALGWVTSEGIAVDEAGIPQDLTIRSFRILRARDTPPIHVSAVSGLPSPVNGSDAVFAAVAAAVWKSRGLPPAWPCP